MEAFNILVVVALFLASAEATGENVCMYKGSSQSPSAIDWSECSSICYSHENVACDSNGGLVWANDPAKTEADFAFIQTISQTHNIPCFFGFSTAGSDNGNSFATVVQNTATFTVLITKVNAVIAEHNLNGVVIDCMNNNAAADVLYNSCLANFLASLRGSFVSLSIYIYAIIGNLDTCNYNYQALSTHCDKIILNNIVQHSGSTTVKNVAPFKQPSSDIALYSVVKCVTYLISQGVIREKIILMISTRSAQYKLNSSSQKAVGSAGTFIGTISYSQLCQSQCRNSPTLLGIVGNVVFSLLYNLGVHLSIFLDSAHQTYYYCSGSTWIGTENLDSACNKASYTVSQGLGGTCMYHVDDDNWDLTLKSGYSLTYSVGKIACH